jgi:hypothetical protein
MKKAFLILLLSLYTVKSGAQIVTADGYLVTNNNDTVSGKLEYFSKGYADRCNIVLNGSKTIEFYHPDQIKGYHILPNLTYHSFSYNGRKHLLRLVSQGKINLYNYKDDLFIADNSGACTKLIGGERTISANGKNYAFNVDGYKIQLKQLIPDSTLYNEIDELPFENADLTRFVRKYNNEPSSNYSTVKRKRNQKNYGILAGYSFNRFLINKQLDFVPDLRELMSNSGEKKHDMEFSNPFVGANFKLQLGEESSFVNFGINVEIVTKQSFSQVLPDLSEVEVAMYTGTVPSGAPGINVYSLHNEFGMNATSIVIPFTYRSVFLFGSFRPYVDLGISSRIFPNHNASLTQVIYQDNEPYYKITDQPSLDLLYAGVMVGPGFNFMINMNNTISAGLSFDYCVPILEDVAFTQIKSVGFYISYSFRKI